VVTEKRDQVVEGFGAVKLSGVDEAHEDVAHVRAVERLIEEGVLPVEDGLLQRALADRMPRAGLCRVGKPTRPVARDLDCASRSDAA
jgi:hypothetical protein